MFSARDVKRGCSVSVLYTGHLKEPGTPLEAGRFLYNNDDNNSGDNNGNDDNDRYVNLSDDCDAGVNDDDVYNTNYAQKLARRDRGERNFLSHLGGSANPAESATLEPDDFHTAGIAIFSKMQRCNLPEVPSITSAEEICGGPGAALTMHGGVALLRDPRGDPRDSGTKYAQRTGETVSGKKTTAGDSESGHKGRALT
ncbi:hypothetical protein DPMN_052382 [Dreissena polymorpha]|uniref:Uncharacterized protein n=1 Tax=Dreissena polymorpha TaxID=45954 RepID=A0A9D4CLN1_DREPO|nr:hypothetical protein DPMN_052382 [Dreissena polymorpha]